MIRFGEQWNKKVNKMGIITIGIIAFNVIFSLQGFNNPAFFERYLFNTSAVQAGDRVRLISSGFLHANWGHLAFNMIAFWSFAPIVSSNFTSLGMLGIYFFALVAGNISALYVHRFNPTYRAVGASGAVSGIVLSSILLYPMGSIYLLFIPFPIPSWLFGIGYILFSVYGMKKQAGNIGHEAHLGGAFAGIIGTIILEPKVIPYFWNYVTSVF